MLDVRGTFIFAVTLYGAASHVLAQPSYVQAVKPMLSAEVQTFDCFKSFNGGGKGLCKGVLKTQFWNAPFRLGLVEYTCTLTLRKTFMHEKEQKHELVALQVAKKTDGAGLESNSEFIEFEKDFTSLIKPTLEVAVSDTQCTVRYNRAN